ncbi:hypothetical protein GGX14DRAFT_2893 [Mycena pura]|uniref:Uncharacterized protein n=1 Tax=Mycena pura TaxID=153505 RepID=A0AAD7E6D3_9AGAR|nr:hypothetical protein GGX14DRAFT_2893 [Mycena pura]
MRHLGYLESPHDSLGPLLCCIGQNVESLIVDTNDETLKDFHFGLPSLCRLECQFSLGSVWNVVARLPDGSRLTDLVLTTSHHVWQFKSSGEHALGLRLEQLVLRKLLCLSALVVEVMVVTPRYETRLIPPLDREEVVRAIEKSMPRLTEKRILSVRFFFEKKRGLY